MSGWIKLHRDLLEWEWYNDANTCRLFIHLLLKANHQDKHWQGLVIKRGQLVTSRGNLSNDAGLSEMQIRVSLNKLKVTREITIQTTSRFTIITICNYDTYQSSDDDDNQPDNQPDNQRVTSEYPADNQRVTTTKELKKGRREENISCAESDKPTSPPLLVFPIKAKAGNPKEWNFCADHLATLTDAFPGIDCLAEARKALGWVKANAAKQKTATGMPRFLYGWIERSNNNGRAVSTQSAPPPPEHKDRLLADTIERYNNVHGPGAYEAMREAEIAKQEELYANF